MKLSIVVSNGDPETVFNALRLGNFSLEKGDMVSVFLINAGVELDRIEDSRFDVRTQAQALLRGGGQIKACGTCLRIRNTEGSELCPLSTMADLYELVRDSDRIVTF